MEDIKPVKFVPQTKLPEGATFQAPKPVEPIKLDTLNTETPVLDVPPKPTSDLATVAKTTAKSALKEPKTFTTPSGAVVDTAGNTISTPPQPEKTTNDILNEFKAKLTETTPTQEQPKSLVEQYNELAQQQQLQEKQRKVDDLTSQVEALQYEADLIPIQLQQEYAGRGATTAGVATIQTGRLRDNALKQLPLIAQLNAAQRRLDSAQSVINTTLDLQYKDNQAMQNYYNTVYDRAYDLASKELQVELDTWKQNKDEQLTAEKNFLDTKRDWVSEAIKAGDYETAAKISGAKDDTELNDLTTQITPQGQKLDTQVVEANGRKILINSQTGEAIRDLGVAKVSETGTPIVLTPEQAADPFIKSLAETAGGKPLTDTSVQKIDKALTVLGQLGLLQENVKDVKTGPITGLFKGANPWDTNAQTIKAQLNAIVPNLARGVYGEVGVLTDNDIRTYSKTLPNLTSTEDVRNAVLGITIDLISKSVKRTLSVNAANNKDVSGFIDLYQEMENTKDSIFSQIPGSNIVQAPDGTFIEITD